MSEIKQVLYDLRTNYKGPFVIEDFYEDIDHWIHEHGHEKENKKKSEHVTKNGKKIQNVFEVHTHLDDFSHGIIVCRIYIEDMKEATITRNGRKIKINHGDILVNVDAFVDAHHHGTFYQQRPVFYMIRTVLDRFIWPFWGEKHDGTVNSQGRELYKRIRSFLNTQKLKYE